MSDQAPAALPRRLGIWTSAAIIMGIIIGSGIFRVPSSVAAEVDSVGAIAMLWVLGGIVALCLSLSLAELSTMFPRAGGIFVYLREAYGPLVAFVFGWTFLLINPASWAAIALIFGEYLSHFIPLGDTGRRVAAALLIAVITIANYFSVPLAAAVQNVATSAKALALLLVAVVIFALASGTDGALAAPISFSVPSIGAFGVALISVAFAYEGAAAFCALSGEVRDPARTLPRALILGVVAVMVLYLLVNAAYLYALPVAVMKTSPLVAADAMSRAAGGVAASVVAALVMLSTFGAVAATAIVDPRVLFAMAREGLFFKMTGAVHSRHQTPHVAVLVSGVIAIAYVSVRAFEQLAATFILGLWPFYALAVFAVIVLRRKRPDLERPYKTLGYPVVPLIFIAVTILILANSLIEQPRITLINIVITLAGIPVYYIWRVVTRSK